MSPLGLALFVFIMPRDKLVLIRNFCLCYEPIMDILHLKWVFTYCFVAHILGSIVIGAIFQQAWVTVYCSITYFLGPVLVGNIFQVKYIFSMALLNIYSVLKVSEMRKNKSGIICIALLHISWVFRWSGISFIKFGRNAYKEMFLNVLQLSKSIGIRA